MRPVDGERKTEGDLEDDLTVAFEIGSNNLLGSPVREPASFYYGESRRRSATKTENLPVGLFSVGDTVASLNPIHGEGISSAASQAAILAAQFAATDDMATRTREFIRNRELITDETWNAEEMTRL